MSKLPAILPCPFCGSPAVIEQCGGAAVATALASHPSSEREDALRAWAEDEQRKRRKAEEDRMNERVHRAEIVEECAKAIHSLKIRHPGYYHIRSLDDAIETIRSLADKTNAAPSPPAGEWQTRPVAFRVKNRAGEWCLFQHEEIAQAAADHLGVEYQGLYARASAPVESGDRGED